MPENVTLIRVNELGVKGIWRCRDDLPPYFEADADVVQLVDIIEGAGGKKP